VHLVAAGQHRLEADDARGFGAERGVRAVGGEQRRAARIGGCRHPVASPDDFEISRCGQLFEQIDRDQQRRQIDDRTRGGRWRMSQR